MHTDATERPLLGPILLCIARTKTAYGTPQYRARTGQGGEGKDGRGLDPGASKYLYNRECGCTSMRPLHNALPRNPPAPRSETQHRRPPLPPAPTAVSTSPTPASHSSRHSIPHAPPSARSPPTRPKTACHHRPSHPPTPPSARYTPTRPNFARQWDS